MKKITMSAVLIFAMALSQGFSAGNVAIGPIFSYGIATAAPLNGLGITGKLPGIDPIFGLNFAIGQSFFVGLTADWYLYNEYLYSPANIGVYLGPGAFGDVFSGSGTTQFDVGLRIPMGLNWKPIRVLEIFTEIAPAFGISAGSSIAPTWRFQGALGARFWF